jgi:hypothetical protein
MLFEARPLTQKEMILFVMKVYLSLDKHYRWAIVMEKIHFDPGCL